MTVHILFAARSRWASGMRGALVVATVGLAACSKVERTGMYLLGDGGHTPAAVNLRTVELEAIEGPTDLAFHPDAPDLAWVVSPLGTGLLAVDGLHGSSPGFDPFVSEGSEHFMANPAAIAFGKPGFLATAQYTDEVTQMATPADFMGPTLWTSDLDEFDGGWASHYDMLHNSPNSVGIAWEVDNAYWVFDGYHQSLTRYDFAQDHDAGGDDHSDGVIRRFVEDEVAYVEGITAHLAVDPAASRLYVADTGNSRIAALDTASGEVGSRIMPNYDMADQREVTGATLTTVAEWTTGQLEAPSGLELRDGILYVSDHDRSRISAFTLDGVLIDYLDLGLPDGSVAGMAFDDDGDLWVANPRDNTLIEISPLADE